MDELLLTQKDFIIESLGDAGVPTPETASVHFVTDEDRIIFHQHLRHQDDYCARNEALPSMELAGPRKNIFFSSGTVKAGIVTCGGLCPGLNTIIRSIVLTAEQFYGISTVYGFRNGYAGLNPDLGIEPIVLTSAMVDNIHEQGGTILSSSRGPQPVDKMVDRLIQLDVRLLFVVGGDGTMRGALDLAQEIKKRGAVISIIGIPKTIDNDIAIIEKSFGFETAVQEASTAITSAHVEAKGAHNGVGIVKLMGRESGFIASAVTLANPVVNYCFIPEVPFRLDGPGGLLSVLEKRLAIKQHAVIVLAEGAAQDLLQGETGHDASGNVKLKDCGVFLSQKIKDHFKGRKIEVNVKYIDPSYMIRSVPATADDNIFCLMLAQNAVHAAMAGKTAMVIGYRNGHYVHLPMTLITRERKKVDPASRLWTTVLETTRQPVMK